MMSPGHFFTISPIHLSSTECTNLISLGLKSLRTNFIRLQVMNQTNFVVFSVWGGWSPKDNKLGLFEVAYLSWKYKTGLSQREMQLSKFKDWNRAVGLKFKEVYIFWKYKHMLTEVGIVHTAQNSVQWFALQGLLNLQLGSHAGLQTSLGWKV